MPPPYKGDRLAILVRVPVATVSHIHALKLVDRNAWINAAIEEKIRKDLGYG